MSWAGGAVRPPPGGWPARLGNPASTLHLCHQNMDFLFQKIVIRQSILRNLFISKLRCGWWRRTRPFRAGADGPLRFPQPAKGGPPSILGWSSSPSAWPSGRGALMCAPLLLAIGAWRRRGLIGECAAMFCGIGAGKLIRRYLPLLLLFTRTCSTT